MKSAGLAFPLEAAAAAKVGEFSRGETQLVVLEIVEEQVVLKASGAAAAATDVQAAVPSSEPSYCLFRWGAEAKVRLAASLPSAAHARGHQGCSPALPRLSPRSSFVSCCRTIYHTQHAPTRTTRTRPARTTHCARTRVHARSSSSSAAPTTRRALCGCRASAAICQGNA